MPGNPRNIFYQMVANLIAATTFVVWTYFITARGGFWAAADLAFTFDSAYQYARNRGGPWKGRIQANVNGV